MVKNDPKVRTSVSIRESVLKKLNHAKIDEGRDRDEILEDALRGYFARSSSRAEAGRA